MKKVILTLMFTLFAGTVYAYDSYDYATVVSVEPIRKEVRVRVPKQHCWNERVAVQHRGNNGSYTDEIVGGILGGVVGNQFGGGSGKDAMTIAGALLGGSIASDHNSGPSYTQYKNVRKCENSYDYETNYKNTGYRVKFRYNGKTYSTQTSSHPGNTIKVRISITPVLD